MVISRSGRNRPTVVIVGAGVAGTLTTIHLVRSAARRSTGINIVPVDPADRWGRGTSFGTVDDQHLLNVPAAGMSALPEDPGHFVAWRRRDNPDESTEAGAFAPRRQYARYLDETLADAMSGALNEATVRHVRTRAVRLHRGPAGPLVATADGRELAGHAVVIATGWVAIIEWVDWYNTRRLHREIGDIPPIEHEADWYRQHIDAFNAA